MNKKAISLAACIFLFICLPVLALAQQLRDSLLSSALIAAEQRAAERFMEGQQTGSNLRNLSSSNFDISYYRCEWDIDPNVRFIKGKVTSYFTIGIATDTIIFDLSDTLTVDSIRYHGSLLSFQRMPGDGLRINFPGILNAGTKDSVSVYYNGVPRRPGGNAFVQTSHAGVPIIWTLSEPFGAKEWWPCKNGVDDKADSVDILVTTPSGYRASSNGVIADENSDGISRTVHFTHRYPMATYLLGLAVTNYVVIKDSVQIAGKQMPLLLTTYPEYAGNAFKINNNARTAFSAFNRLFGDYPFAREQYGQTAWSQGGGMEHQTNSFITTTDLGLISHELGHQWFGDRITCGSWHDIWLNEGFATYAQSICYESFDLNLFRAERQYYRDVITAQPAGSVWVDDTTSFNRIFSGRLSYNKGSYLLHMLRWRLGDSVFFRGIRRYLTDPLLQYKFALTADFQRNMETESGKNLSSFFQQWFYGQGYPSYTVQWSQDNTNRLYVKINQATSHPSVSFYDMPVPIQFKNSNRDTIIVFNNLKNGESYLVNPGFRADTAIFDPHFWLLCKNSTQQIACTGISADDVSFPFYNIVWSQNANQWSQVTITQQNSAAVAAAENIPLYLHFAADGRDTAIEIKNIRYRQAGWYNIGFKASSVYITSSCLLEQHYLLREETSNKSSNEIKIYPVPVSGSELTVALNNPTDKQLTMLLYNAAGQLLLRRSEPTPGKNELFTLPTQQLPHGVYFLRLYSATAIHTTRKINR